MGETITFGGLNSMMISIRVESNFIHKIADVNAKRFGDFNE
jgi:hypothetical protein